MKILFAEDHHIIRGIITRLISDEIDCVINECHDGHEAIEKLKKENFDLAVIDYHMPRVDGLELLKHIKTNYPATKTIMLSMVDDERKIKEIMDSGADAYVLKEGDSGNLVKAIKDIMQ